MITNKKFVIVFAVSIVAYLISDLFFNDAFLYLVGGVLGALLRPIGLLKIPLIAWFVVLIAFVILYQKINQGIFKWIIFILIWTLLYIVDFGLYKILPDITEKVDRYLHIGISVILKASLLTWIYYMGSRRTAKIV